MLNFFDPAFQEKPSNVQFGLCDNEDGAVAFTDTMNKDKWDTKRYFAAWINNKTF